MFRSLSLYSGRRKTVVKPVDSNAFGKLALSWAGNEKRCGM